MGVPFGASTLSPAGGRGERSFGSIRGYLVTMTHMAFLGTGLLGSALVEAAAKRGGDDISENHWWDNLPR